MRWTRKRPERAHPGPDLPVGVTVDALLRVYVAGLGSGHHTALDNVGVPDHAARIITQAYINATGADPLSRNAAADFAVMAFLDDYTDLPAGGVVRTVIELNPGGEL